ncbi:retrovirus-related Pol polyprotein from type-2 retrotransposable element R2DM [Trichonephila clavipes]|nr:retrovirus-related Pol polyprotein from type-2 retrotransposable element R2DM [Trichonephila clavipes]
MKCLARDLSVWRDIHGVISPAQKGFLPHDGVIEHNFLITQHLEEARRRKQDRYLAWLDISNAFDSVPHVIINALVPKHTTCVMPVGMYIIKKSRFKFLCTYDECNLTTRILRLLEPIEVPRMVDIDILMVIWKNRVKKIDFVLKWLSRVGSEVGPTKGQGKAGCFLFGSQSQTARFRACIEVIKHKEPIRCIDLNSTNQSEAVTSIRCCQSTDPAFPIDLMLP